MKTAILFSGTSYNFRQSIESLRDNLVNENNADVFIVTSRHNMRRRTSKGSPIPLADDPNQGLWNAKSHCMTRDETPLDESDIAFIRETFGNSLKALVFIEDRPEYLDYLKAERIKMMMLINEYRSENLLKRLPAPFGGDATIPDNGNIKCVVDQYNHAKLCYQIMKEHGQYDYVMRARIDFICPFKFNLEHYYLNQDHAYLYLCGSVRKDTFEWADEFCWFSRIDIADKLFPALDRMGFITDRKHTTLTVDNDFVFTPETQFSLLLYDLDIQIANVKIFRSACFTNAGEFDCYNYKFRRDLDIEHEFELVKRGPSDINEHIQTLREYGEKCEHITELGTRYGNSAIAFLAAKPKKFISYDVQHNNKIDYLRLLGADVRIENPQEIEQTDLLFIDTDHHVEQCSKELALHADKVRKYLIFHDTTYFWEKGQGHDVGGGLRYAIEPFMASHPEWQQLQKFTNNNGLLILHRC
jgi:hypothetical protein